MPGPGIRKIGLQDPAAVRLTMAPDVLAPVRERVAATASRIAAGQLHVPTAYDGPEFTG